jgi:hypothetical protein
MSEFRVRRLRSEEGVAALYSLETLARGPGQMLFEASDPMTESEVRAALAERGENPSTIEFAIDNALEDPAQV